MSRFLCWLGFHAWAYEYGNTHGVMQERRCYRCHLREAPYVAGAVLHRPVRLYSVRPESEEGVSAA